MAEVSSIPIAFCRQLPAMVLLVLNACLMHAQSGFRDGYILRNSGDTLTGLVDYSLNSRLKAQCRFKRFDIAPVVKYRPGEISGYGFTGGRHFNTEFRKRKTRFSEERTGGIPVTPSVRIWKDVSVTQSAPGWRVGVVAGYQFLRIRIPAAALTRYFGEAEYDRGIRPLAGLTLSRFVSRKTKHFSADLSLLFTSGRYYGYAAYTTLAECRDEVFIRYSGLQVPLALRFNFSGKNLNPFVKTGVYATFMMDTDYMRFSERQFGSELFMDWYHDFKPKNEVGYFGSVGTDIRLGPVRYVTLEALFMLGSEPLIYQNTVYSEPLSTRVHSSVVSIMLSVNL
jgi:hypothetical protein